MLGTLAFMVLLLAFLIAGESDYQSRCVDMMPSDGWWLESERGW